MKITIIILITLLFLTGFMFLLYANFHYQTVLDIEGRHLEEEIKYLDNFSELMSGYNELQTRYDNLEEAYETLASEKYILYSMFEVTAYTQNECGSITYAGLDLNSNYAKYLNVAAVDPDLIELGSIVLIRFDNGQVKPYIALDTGGAIKGKRIDLYFTDLDKAIEFGRQQLEVGVID
jgi:3D (Asp-Asp-Asp) domain-containing protein